jgi:serine/threonine protein kinase
VPPPGPPQTALVLGGGDGDPDVYAPGTEVVIGGHRFRCTGVLGRGSFSEVWSGEEIGIQEHLEVALKDIGCAQQSDLQQALFEANMLMGFAAAANCSYGQGAAPPQLRIPRYLSHRVDHKKSGEGWRVRMAMTRVPGEPLDSFLKRPPPPGQDVQASVRRGCMLAMQMIRQLGPSLEIISQRAVHRDVNAHNVLLSDAVDGGVFRCNAEPEEAASRANFWLIDFGLAVDSTTWHTAWRDADIGGDCRYWPQSSWFVSFWGADEIAAQKDLCKQYMTRLDIFGLGITALELLCTTALDGSNAAGCQSGSSDGLRGSWRRLLNAWTKYWTDVTRWHTMIYRVFSLGGDVGPLYQELAKERVVDKILSRMAQIRQCLRACVHRTEDPRIQSLLSVIAEMLDEASTVGLREAVNALGGEVPPHPCTQHNSANGNYFQPKPISAFPGPSPAQAAVNAMRAEGQAAQAAAHGMVAQVTASARGRAEALQEHAQHTARRAADSSSFMAARVAAAQNGGGKEDAQAMKLQWCAPSVNNNNSFAPPVPQSNSFVPPPLSAPPSGQFSANNSYVPMPVTMTAPSGGSYVPAAPVPAVVLPTAITASLPTRDNLMPAQSQLKHGPPRTARPQYAGA